MQGRVSCKELELKVAKLEEELRLLKLASSPNAFREAVPSGKNFAPPSPENMEKALAAQEMALRISQEQLVRSREQLQLVTDAVPVFIAYLDKNCIYRFANACYESVFGVKKEEIIGQSIQKILGEEGFRMAKSRIDGALAGERQEFYFSFHLNNNDLRYFHSIYIPHMVKGEVDGFFVLSRDLTDETRTREALHDSEARFESVINSMPDIIFTLDSAHRHTGVYGEWLQRFNISPDIFLGKTAQEILGVEEGRKHIEASIKALKGETVVYEWMTNRPDGEKQVIQTSLSPLRDRSGNIIGSTGVGRDITERIRFEVEMEIARNEAEKASKAKSELLANMSHEIRTPLNVVTGFSELLSSMVSDPRQRSYLQAIKTAGKSLMRLLDDILDLSKIEAGMMDIQLAPVHLPSLINEIGKIFSPRISEKGLEWRVTWDERLPETLLLDEIRIRQILLNLTGNAVKFTQGGYICVSVRKGRLCSEKNGGKKYHLIMTVRDSGIGIPAPQLQHIFESFRQHSPQIHRQYGGAGLGLTISKKLAELMNGKLTVKSKEGKGSSFSLILPDIAAAPNAIETSVENGADNEWRFQPVKVLAADNDEANRALLKALLEPANLEIIEARDGSEAVELSLSHRPSLILMDLRMPVLDGLDAARRIRNVLLNTTPIIAISASPASEPIQPEPEFLFDGRLSKPLDIKLLFDLLRRFLPVMDPKSPHSPAATTASPDAAIDAQTFAAIQLDLTHIILPKIKKLSIGMKMSDARLLSQILISLGERQGIPFLIACGEQLDQSSRIFDVNNIKKIIKDLQEAFHQDFHGDKTQHGKKSSSRHSDRR